MNTIKLIRERLGLTQAALAAGMGCTQGNVGHYERGQTVPPDAAKRLIEYASSLGLVLTYNDVYMQDQAAAFAVIAQPAIEVIAEKQPHEAPAPDPLAYLDHGERERRERERRAHERRASDDAPWHGGERRSPQTQPYPFPDIDRRAATESVTSKT